MVGIYMIKNLKNDNIYIGQSKNIEKRWKEHIKELNGNYHPNKKMQHDWNKYGKDYFEFSIVIECDIKELQELEILYIKEFNSYEKGYNETIGGIGMSGFKPSYETRKLQSENTKGENNPFYGKHHTDEAKQKMSEHAKGKYCGEDNPFYGKHHTDETKQKISESRKGKYCGEDSPNFGIKRSDEIRKRMSENHANFKGKNNPHALKLVCIFPSGYISETMTLGEMSEYLGINTRLVSEIAKKEEEYMPRKNRLKNLKGIRIIKL